MDGTAEKVPQAIVREAVETARRFFPQLMDALGRVAADLQQDRVNEAMTLFASANDGLKWFCSMVELRKVWLPAGPLAGVLEDRWDPFVQALSDLAEALGRADYVLVGDILEFEVVSFIRSVLEVMDSLPAAGVADAV